jgi:hypothetical protein
MLMSKKNRKNEKKKKEGSWKFVKPTIVKFCTMWLISPLFVVVLYLWIDWELDVMGTPTKVYSLIKSLLSITCVYLKRELQVPKAVHFSPYQIPLHFRFACPQANALLF